MLEMLRNAFRVPELRGRVLFVFGMFGVFVVGTHIPVPGVDHRVLDALFEKHGAGVLGLIDVFGGGALRRYSILAMGIMPYITSSIMMQLLTVAVPSLEQLQKEGGEAGRKKISQYIRYLTIVLAVVQAFGMNMSFARAKIFIGGPVGFVQVVVAQTAGTCFLMWLGELITEKGIGNGVSLIIFCGIVNRMPYYMLQTYRLVASGAVSFFNLLFFLVLFFGTIVFVVLITQGQRRIPIQHAQRVVGTKMTRGGMSFLPLRVNTAGVIPIIFAIAIVTIPATFLQMIPSTHPMYPYLNWIAMRLSPAGGNVIGLTLYAALVILFTYFYTSVTMDISNMSDNLKKWGSFVPGIRPGKPTHDYLDRVVSRITLAGAIFLAIIAVLQYVVPPATGIKTFSGIVGGTSLLIMVGVALETMQQIEAHLLMRHYEGFIK
jgi:preprotein translocase subunit SecY